MRLYRLNIAPGENDSEGENFDEWYGSLRAARRRRAELGRNWIDPEDHSRGGDTGSIDRVTIASLSPRRLVLALLNGRGWMTANEQVDGPLPEPADRHFFCDYCETLTQHPHEC